MDREFSFGGRNFKLSKIDAFKQLNIVRRITPILSELLPAFQQIGLKGGFAKIGAIEALPENEKLEMVSKFLSPILTGMSKLSDEDTEKVLFGLLSSAEVQQAAGNWARVSTDKMLMIQDLELAAMLTIAGRAFMFNLSGFFSALPQK